MTAQPLLDLLARLEAELHHPGQACSPERLEQLRLMDPALFGDAAIGLRDRLLATPLAQRFELDREHRLLFINFEGLSVERTEDIAAIEQMVSGLLEPLTAGTEQRFAAVVNYDNFHILPGLVDAYSEMVGRLSRRYYSRVTRYGTGGFLKARLEGRGAG